MAKRPSPKRQPPTKRQSLAKRQSPATRQILRTELPNGVRVISESVRGARTVAMGVWVQAGSRYEDLKQSGMTYLIQRLAFYGTRNRSAEEVADAVDALGGNVSTHTGRDHASYVARVGAKDLGGALELLADLALRPRLGEQGFADEQNRLLEKLRAAEKDPDLVLERMFLRSLWKGHGLCRPPHGRLLASGGATRLENFQLKSLKRFHEHTHHPRGLTIAAAGKVDHDKFLGLAEKHFSSLEEPRTTASSHETTSYPFLALRHRPRFSSVRFQLGCSACAADDERRHAAGILNAIVARGAGSRLMRLKRQQKLNAAEVSSSLLMFGDAGCFSVRLRTGRTHLKAALRRVLVELQELAATLVGPAELKRAKATRKGALLEELDSLPERVKSLARRERYFGKVIPFEDEAAAIDDAGAEQIRSLATEWFSSYNLSLAVLGKLDGIRISRAILQPRLQAR